MNKRITSILLCFVMMFSMLATAVPALAAPASTCTFTVEADKSEAHRGDTITFTVYLQQTGKQNTLEFTVVPPEGLTYVANSATLGENIKETMGFDEVAWTEQSMYCSGFGAYSYEGTDKLTLLTFKCTVDDDAAFKTYEFGLVDHWADDETYNTKNAVVVPATFSVVAKPVAVTGVTIDETLSVKTGELKTPSYTVNPAEATNKAVSFKSDNPAVATVNETTGEVTGVKEGTATITITTADGNFTDTCVVTVACSHANKTPVAEKASDCKNKGWDAYVKCNDCGQLFAEDGTTEIAEIPFRALSSNHTGGTATCTAQAVCTVCSQPYGALAAHSYTSTDKKTEALKTEGNCNDYAVYFYSCSACGKVEKNDSHVFLGEKNANNHVGGTALVNQSEENHKTQTDGYTGDTKCLGCGVIIGYGQSIPAGAHTPAGVWSNDPTHHWKECTVVGCGIVIDGSMAEHKSEKAENKATCQKAAVCDVCGVSYGTVADHDWNTSSWEKDATGHWHKCNTAGCTEKKDFATHSGGTATCTAKANCSVCGEPHGDLAAHDYTAQTKKPEALKSEGNCRDVAVYYYSCSACGEVENNDSHTFNGDKVPGTHVGGTALVNQSEENHKTQTDGYTGDTKCLGCGEIIDYGDPILAGAHTPAGVWSTDPTHHWKECTVVGCGIVIDGSKAEHTSTGANVATCQKAAVCDVCGVSYGTVADHDWNTSSWEKDATGHWHKCNTAGCTETNAFAAHTPDHQGGATEEYAIKCTICQFEIEAQLGHTHVFDQEVVADRYLASKANCTDPAKYYKSCRCGEKGTEPFTSGEALGHTEGTEWEKDATGHWHKCNTAGCTETKDFDTHTPDHQGGATEEYAIKCSVCGYEIEAQLQHTHVFDQEVVADQYLASKANCTDPAKYYKSCKCGEKGTDTFTSGAALGHTEGTEWEKDATGHWHICTVAGCGVVIDSSKAAHTPDRDAATETDPIKCSVCGFEIAPALGHTHAHGTDWKSDKDNHWNECACGDKANTAAHKDENTDGKCDVCEYNVGLPANPDSPQTGDNSMMHLWIILLCVSGLGVIATTVLGKKRFVK